MLAAANRPETKSPGGVSSGAGQRAWMEPATAKNRRSKAANMRTAERRTTSTTTPAVIVYSRLLTQTPALRPLAWGSAVPSVIATKNRMPATTARAELGAKRVERGGCWPDIVPPRRRWEWYE